MITKSRVVLTVDGLAGSGKTTLSRLLAERLGFAHLNSGALYRAVGFLALREKIALNDEPRLVERLKAHRLALELDDEGHTRVLLDGKDVAGEIFTPEVSEATSTVAALAGVRTALVAAQNGAFAGRDLVAEGRDMGTVIFPEAKLKFFVTASESVRTERRLAQLVAADPSQSPDLLRQKIRVEILERDQRDTERAISPTKAAQDAVLIDNSGQTLTEVVGKMYDFVSERGLLGSSR